jgi:Protein of unknown function (DUF3592)
VRQHPSFLSLAKRSFPFWFGGIWLFCGAPFLILGLYMGVETIRQQARFEREGQVTQGMVLTKRVSRSKDSQGRQSTSYWVGYRFSAPDGTVVKREAQVTGQVWDRLVEREPVSVTYLPGRPGTSRIEGEASEWMLPGVFALLGFVFAGAGGLIFFNGVRGIRRELRLREEGTIVEATVVEVGPGNVSFNGVPQWRILYSYQDHRGRTHGGESNVMAPEAAQAWKIGDKGIARFDTRAPKKSIWVGKA